MAAIVTDSKHYSDIAAAIRAKTESSETYKPSEMAAAIEAIKTGGGNIETCKITVQSFAANIVKIIYFSSENGDYKKNEITYSPAVANLIMNNVVRGSYVYIKTNYAYCWFDHSGNMYFINSGYTACDLSPDGDMHIEIIDDD